MSELTFEHQAMHICSDCQIKHITDLKAHMDNLDPDYKTIEKMADSIARHVGMNKKEYSSYESIREVEHKLEDYMTVLRRMRRTVQSGEKPNPIAWSACEKAHPETQRKILQCTRQGTSLKTCRTSNKCLHKFLTV